MHVQLNHPVRSIEVKGPKRVKDLLRELNLQLLPRLTKQAGDMLCAEQIEHRAHFEHREKIIRINLIELYVVNGHDGLLSHRFYRN